MTTNKITTRSEADENRDHCRQIAMEAEAYADGNVYRCPDCGEEFQLPDNVGDKFRCPQCHAVNEVDDLEQLSLYDYLSDVLDIEYRIDSDRTTIRSAAFMVAFGGPTIYIDTGSQAVELYWWTERARYPLTSELCDQLNEYAQELWDMG